MPSRQYLQQLRNRAQGMCGTHKHLPIFKGGLCESCYAKRKAWRAIQPNFSGPRGSYLPRMDWQDVDFTRTPTEIAAETGRPLSTVYYQIRKHGLKPVKTTKQPFGKGC